MLVECFIPRKNTLSVMNTVFTYKRQPLTFGVRSNKVNKSFNIKKNTTANIAFYGKGETKPQKFNTKLSSNNI